eukprot:CAMPEP_0114554996 /NCGR_PEP_ID=MMETSP0114-20121206/8512_1 /TAXON_ID=31324 /ORGANISM="Goniomonas sp, Strain m" /LENGTH=434 /DNA_ID=CAMNT_0001740089 /DNA_START=138 /DNA_END=1442 /DNA_ORIENTATION=-
MPGIAFFEAGLLRSKNSLSIILQVVSGIVMLSVLWTVVGYSLVFGTDNFGFIGDLKHIMLVDVPYDDCTKYAPNIPAGAFALFMMMFAAITPLLMTGAYAERMPAASSWLFSFLWEILIFYPVAHWIWGGGWLKPEGCTDSDRWLCAQDFAGGIVIHTTAGTGSIVVAKMLGRRNGYDRYHGEFPPSNIPLAAVGAAFLWLGWFGFNAGSALQSGAVATSAIVSTQIAASCCALVWIISSGILNEEHAHRPMAENFGKPSVVGALNGVMAGLAGVTPASGFINTQSTIILGLILGLTSFPAQRILKHKLRIDDALDVSVVHGLTGVIGSLFIGFAAESSLADGGRDGIFFGTHSFALLMSQIVAVLAAMVWAGVWTYVIVKIVAATTGLRVSDEDEEVGLDLSQHGEFAYHNLQLKGQEPLFKEGGDDHSMYGI